MKNKLIKTFVILLTCASMLAALVSAVGAESGRHTASLGDLDKNGSSDVVDYMMLKRHVLGAFELSIVQACCADVNLDGTVDSVDYMTLKRIVLGTFELPQPDWDTPIAESTDAQLRERINYKLAASRETGRISVGFTADATAETIAATFAEAGLSSDLQDTSVYTSFVSLPDGSCSYTVRVSEETIRDVMFALYRSENVRYVEPFLLIVPA